MGNFTAKCFGVCLFTLFTLQCLQHKMVAGVCYDIALRFNTVKDKYVFRLGWAGNKALLLQGPLVSLVCLGYVHRNNFWVACLYNVSWHPRILFKVYIRYRKTEMSIVNHLCWSPRQWFTIQTFCQKDIFFFIGRVCCKIFDNCLVTLSMLYDVLTNSNLSSFLC